MNKINNGLNPFESYKVQNLLSDFEADLTACYDDLEEVNDLIVQNKTQIGILKQALADTKGEFTLEVKVDSDDNGRDYWEPVFPNSTGVSSDDVFRLVPVKAEKPFIPVTLTAFKAGAKFVSKDGSLVMKYAYTTADGRIWTEIEGVPSLLPADLELLETTLRTGTVAKPDEALDDVSDSILVELLKIFSDLAPAQKKGWTDHGIN